MHWRRKSVKTHPRDLTLRSVKEDMTCAMQKISFDRLSMVFSDFLRWVNHIQQFFFKLSLKAKVHVTASIW